MTIAGFAWPHDVAGEFGPKTQGSRLWTVFGLVVLSAGAAFALVGIIGWESSTAESRALTVW